MRRWLGGLPAPVALLAATAVALVGLFWPVIFSAGDGSAGQPPDSATIVRYVDDLTVDRDGSLQAVETVTTDMPSGKHGIFRFWDIGYPPDPHVRLVPHDIEVRADGRPVPVQLSWQQGRYRVAKVGDPDVVLSPGRHVYRISYQVDGVLAPGNGGGSVFYWNVVPGGWAMAIESSVSRLHLPAPAQGLQCTSSRQSTGPCTVSGAGTRAVSVRAGPLAPFTPVTVRTDLAVPPPAQVRVPWSLGLDPVLSRSPLLAGGLLLLAVATGVAGWSLARRTREEQPGLPLMYAPPERVGPVQAAYVVTERVPDAAVVATLLYTAEQQLTRLTRTQSDDWVVEGLVPKTQWEATDPVTRSLGKALGVARLGGVFEADGSVSSGSTLQSATRDLHHATTSWAGRGGLVTRSTVGIVGRVLVLAAIVVAAFVFVANPLGATLAGLPAASFAVLGLPLLRSGSSTRRTDAGRELWSRAGGFRRILATPSSVQRFDFSGRQELYTAYIPWAVAFDCADEWQRKYETEMAAPAPVPIWFYGPVGSWTSPSSAVSSFQGSLTATVAAYAATQTSSSSGGGFSGGGGGGGGGGGSW